MSMSMSMTDHRIRTLVAAPHRLHSKKNNIARRTRDVVIAKTAFGLESLKVFVHSVASEAAWRFNNRPRPCPPPKPLPAELWIQIIEQDSSCEEWIALAKTCWFFHQIAQPCLYKHATVGKYCSPNHTTTTAAHKHNHSSRRIPLDVFSRTIQCRPDLAAFVRNLTLHAAPPSHAHEHTPAPAWLTRLPNLTTLHLTNYTLTPAFCGALRTLPRLRLTRYEHCRASSDLLLAAYPHPHPHPHSQHPQHRAAVEIRAPHICKAAAFPNAWTAVVPAGVAALALHCTPPAYLDLVLSSIMLMRGNAQLTALSLGTSYPPDRGRVADTLPAFLASAPLLRRLALNFWTSDASVLQASLPADAVPLLEDFTGPPALFDVFLRGRPVRRVGAFFDVRAGSSVAPESLVPLALSAVPVTELALDVGRGLLHSDVRDVGAIGACLLHAPVSVRRLTWSYVSAADLLTFLPALSRLKNLRELRVGGGVRGGGDCTPLSEIAAACPKLCEVYTERHVWVRRLQCAGSGGGGVQWDRFFVAA